MVCGTCGATIADKAIVCYRCGTATALPPAPARTPAPRPGRPWFIVVLLLVVSAVMGWVASIDPIGTTEQIVLAIAAVLLAAGGVYLAARRPR